jgi:hypothetical protein
MANGTLPINKLYNNLLSYAKNTNTNRNNKTWVANFNKKATIPEYEKSVLNIW